MRKILFLGSICLAVFSGCASLSQMELAQLKPGMTADEVKRQVGRPLYTYHASVMRENKMVRVPVKIWEYGNLYQSKVTLLFFCGDELKQIEPGEHLNPQWPNIKFDCEGVPSPTNPEGLKP